jgi:hypothetical protein
VASPRVSVKIIDTNMRYIEKAILGKMEAKLRDYHKKIAAGMISEWNKIAISNMSRESGEGDTNNMVRSMFSTMSDLKDGALFNPPTPTYQRSKHRNKNRYLEKFGFWSEDNFSKIASVTKQNIKHWTIMIKLDKFIESAKFATEIIYRRKKDGAINKFNYMKTAINEVRIGVSILDFTNRSGDIAKQYADRIFGLAGGSIRTVLG